MISIIINIGAGQKNFLFFTIAVSAIVFIVVIIKIVLHLIYKRRLLSSFSEGSNADSVLNAKECEKHMTHLAGQHQRVQLGKSNFFIKKINRMVYIKLNIFRFHLAKTPAGIISLIPAARWLFDNFYLMYSALKKIHSFGMRHRMLPLLKSGQYKGYPRIYILAREVIYAAGRHLKEENIYSMLKTYQSVTPLTSVEIWAFLEIVGLCLLENIIHVAGEIIQVIDKKAAADKFVHEKLALQMGKLDISTALSSGINKQKTSDIVFLSHVLYCLKNMSVDETQINICAENLVSDKQITIKAAEIFSEESHFEAHLESVIRTLVISLKEAESINVEDMFEAVSPLENILNHDPAGVYKKMDFETRSRYRYVVEKFSRQFKKTEWDIAKRVVEIAAEKKDDTKIHCADHVGTYLVGKGKPILKASLSNRPLHFKRTAPNNHKGKLFYFIITLLSIAVLALLLWALFRIGYQPCDAGVIFFFITALFPVMGIAIELTNYAFTHIVHQKVLPALDFIEDIPDEYRTVVAMPVILANENQIRVYAERMEKYYFANKQRNLYFAILGDFFDATQRVMPEDENILNAAMDTIQLLNQKYPAEYPRFLLFMRYRKWNKSEGCWMGWERKRGKLEEFNALLCGKKDTTFSLVQGEQTLLSTFKYVITIDSDTDLIRDSAAKLVGIMAHPLNKTVIDPKTNKVKEGYAIVQSEIRNHILTHSRCPFSRTFAGQIGLDIYSNVVADVYQDTFEEGIFVGKGIYDVRALHQILYKTFPDNSVLSHDLLESCYARCAFASNVKLMDNYPSSVDAYIKREHRWIRGDWQLLPWLIKGSRLNGVSRWKIFDNLRRSLIPFCRLSVMLINIFLLPRVFYLWIPIMFFDNVFHILLTILKTFKQKIIHPTERIPFLSLSNTLENLAEQAVYRFILMPYRAWVALDAIFRTIFRLFFSHRRLLQWQASDITERNGVKSITGYYRSMWMVVLPAAAMILTAILNGLMLAEKLVCIFIGLMWLLSPMIAYFISRKNEGMTSTRLHDSDKKMLRLAARRTWQYFKEFTTPENNWLCPDNYQISPNKKVSDKTSPTNIGLQLLSLLSAYDFGFTGLCAFIDDCENIIYTIATLPKWNGHLYNWYNIKTLEVLNPQYISTVDSGNFISYLITLKNGFAAIQNQPVFSSAAIEGIANTITLAGMDINLPVEFPTAASFIEMLQEIKQKAQQEDLKPWENAKWRHILVNTCSDLLKDAEHFTAPEVPFTMQKKLNELAREGVQEAVTLIARLNGLISSIENLIENTDFKPLFDKRRMLFHIGYSVTSQALDAGYYDLIASESCLTSLLAIAKNDVPQKHWLKLGRPLTIIRGIPAFVSWSGTMFEYLMPNLVMKEYPGSVFDQSAKAAVCQQILYAKKRKIPWGLSESQYFRFDVESNYQYRAFGVPKIRLQPILDASLVVAPYATLLAVDKLPRKAMKNMKMLLKCDVEGDFGYYEAVDFNSPDASTMRPYSIVRSFMAHHQGMNLVAINNLLHQKIMQRRFHNEPMIKAVEILLEEMRGTGVLSIARKGYAIDIKQMDFVEEIPESRMINGTAPIYPNAHWLSNGRYKLMITSDGDGFSSYKDIMVNRWRSNLLSSAGSYIYICDTAEKKYWSTAFKPTLVEPDSYQVIFSHNQAEFKRRDGDITTHTAITLSCTQNFEVRKVTISNNGSKPVLLDITSYIETVLASFLAELYHPAFNRLSIESEYINELSMLIYKNRKNSKLKEQPYLIHMVKTDARKIRNTEYETDRRYFLGRNNTVQNPDVITEGLPLSNAAGHSLDPIASLRTSISIPAGRGATVSFITGICFSKDEARSIAEQLDDSFSIDDIFTQFRLNSELEMKYLGVKSAQINTFQDLIGPLFYPFASYRGPSECIIRNWKDQSFLWRFGISGDNPIMLLRVKSVEEARIIKDVLMTYEYMRINKLNVDLIILNEEKEGYMQNLNCMLAEMTSRLKAYDESSNRPSLYILNAYQMQPPELDLLFTVARIVFTESTGIFFRKIREKMLNETHIKSLSNPDAGADQDISFLPAPAHTIQGTQLQYFNGYGGFNKTGTEYEILLDREHKPPAPWVNIIANDSFGFQVSETGAGYTWSVNSRENKITSWSNDPVTDPVSEALYIRDKKTGLVSSPAAIGCVKDGLYHIRHGFGYSIFEHDEQDLIQEMTVFVPTEEPVKIWKLALKNKASVKRKLEITLFIEWVLGVDHELSALYIVTGYNREYEYLSAKNTYNYYFRNHTAFLFSSEKIISFTGDRREFLGVTSSLQKPIGLSKKLSENTGAALEPCGAIRIAVTINPDEKKEIVFGLGQSEDVKKINAVCLKYRNPAEADMELEKVQAYWKRLTQTVSVKTKDHALDIMANGWLLYQTISCRLKARTAFYQCGGAFGFRDQLQDVMALLDVDPLQARKQILLASSRQFEEGDVQHWWHPPVGLGVRTRFADDLLWLPYVTAAYIEHTGDYTILDEEVPYITGPPLMPNENEAMGVPKVTETASNVYEHCLRAILKTRFGKHGLPLMGGGDWNDGMNCIGIHGEGESVWLGWFVYSVYMGFIDLCKYKNDHFHASNFIIAASELKISLEENAWDGEWYMRAFYDDGEKIGSKENEECRIDSISQSWSTISDGGSKNRIIQALRSAERYLVKPEEGLSLLLTPPFDKTPKYPGYIKDYFPGLRENGGQYTQAAVWLAIAFAKMKDCSKAYYLLSMLNPIYIAMTQKSATKYEKEPYIMPADISMGTTYAGRGGWTWYTGSSGWMYQALMWWFLGLKKQGNTMTIDPAIPVSFGSYTIKYNFGDTLYNIKVKDRGETDLKIRSIIVDGNEINGNCFELRDDKKMHYVIA